MKHGDLDLWIMIKRLGCLITMSDGVFGIADGVGNRNHDRGQGYRGDRRLLLLPNSRRPEDDSCAPVLPLTLVLSQSLCFCLSLVFSLSGFVSVC